MSIQRYEPVYIYAGNAPGAAGDETSSLHVLDTLPVETSLPDAKCGCEIQNI